MTTTTRNSTSDDKLALLTTNHNYFVRQTISTVCGLVILSLIYLFILLMCLPNLERAATDSTYANTGVFVILASLGFLVLVIVQVSKLITLHAKITSIEDSFIFVINGEPTYSMHKLSKK